MKNTKNAFTLIELLIVITIIGILATIFSISLLSASDLAKDARKKADINQLSKLFTIHKITNPEISFPIDNCNIGESTGGSNPCSQEVNNFLGSISIKDPDGKYYKYQSTDGENFKISAELSNNRIIVFDSENNNYTQSVGENGSCGTATIGNLYLTPTTNLCDKGTPDTITGTGPWNWNCISQNGGIDASCTANKITWSDAGNALPTYVEKGQLVIINNNIYLFGGNNPNDKKSIYQASISEPTTWTDTGSKLPANVSTSQSAIIGSYVYLFGGGEYPVFDNIYRAPLSNPTAWEDTGSRLAVKTRLSQSAIIGDYIYLFGGYYTSVLNNIQRAPLSNPTTWTDTGSTLPQPISKGKTVTMGDYVYLFGGSNESYQTLDTIYKAPISNPTAFIDTGKKLPHAVEQFETTIIDGYIYILGGYTNQEGAQNSIYRASLSDPTTWTNTDVKLAKQTTFPQVGIIEDNIYIFGGNNGTSPTGYIYKAPLR